MAINKQDFSAYIKQFKFRELFNEMGWNNDKTKQPIVVDEITFLLQSVAEKSGFKILLCNPADKGLIPDYNTRKKIETKVTKLFQEHLIIFCDAKNQEQIWQLVVRQSGKPSKVTETRYHISQDPELLYQRASGIFFEMDEEEKITIVDVKSRITENFHANAEKVTKQFYDKFKKEHTSFLGFIKGIDEKVNKDWYASLMLNRLMFCYFIQKKGFLDNNKNYLRDKLNACQVRKGKNKFYSFYRDFLLVLFHHGLNEAKQKDEVKIEIGKIPYLNGGLFDEHELEKMYNAIDIEDKAFERVFDFFDQYEWHLDTRITATGRDINPDVIGYIFEKYINDRANMGAYYTKEDITDYISKNCILPYLFDETKRQYPKAFSNDGEIWETVKQSSDNYIYDAVKKGVQLPLPAEIITGIDTQKPNLIERRKEWNKPASPEFALTTEIWREVVDRRNRYADVKSKIEKGEINSVNDFITYNLNIRQFAQDVIENTDDPDFLRHFYKAINSVTILDPTCGSGAFLFAAMNILEPLYESCIMRMRAFTEDEDRKNKAEKKNFSNKYKFFRSVLEEIQIEHHPNLQYFIYKSIILRNLFGVDIMKEAVEIAKLRLFLKLVATVEVDYRKPNLGLEPLPDIDFNIRAGNTLIGIATEEEFVRQLHGSMELGKGKVSYLDFDDNEGKIRERMDVVARAFTRYKEIQLGDGDDYKEFKKAKVELNKRLKELNHELNLLLHKQASAIKYETWLQTHQPFHWFAEFYEIIHDKGGFDVVIGNPPYVVYNKKDKVSKKSVADIYKLTNYKTIATGNLFSFVMEKAYSISNNNAKIGLIIPLSGFSITNYSTLQEVCFNNAQSWISNFSGDAHPAELFNGVNIRLSILLSSKKEKSNSIFSTKYIKFYQDEREYLFYNLTYTKGIYIKNIGVLKLGKDIEQSIYEKYQVQDKFYKAQLGSNTEFIYHAAPIFWTKAFLNLDFFAENKLNISGAYKTIKISTEYKNLIFSIINSSLFFYQWIISSDCYNLTKGDIEKLTLPKSFDKYKINKLSSLLHKSLYENCNITVYNYADRGEVNFAQFYPKKSKPIIDEIDTVLAEYYGFTAEELDFIINYDIKYRMGKELENGEEE